MAWTVVGAAIAGMLITGKAMSDPDVLNCPYVVLSVEEHNGRHDTTADLANRANPGGLNNEQLKLIGDYLLRQQNPLLAGTEVKVPIVDTHQC